MRALRLTDPAELLARTEALRAAQPAVTNVIGTIARSAADGRAFEATYWWLVVDDADTVVGCALRTSPWKLQVSPMPVAAAQALGAAVAATDPDLPGIAGPPDVVRGVVEGLRAAGVDGREQVAMSEVVHVLGDYLPPPPTPGQARRATEADVELLVEWYTAFSVEIRLVAHEPRPSVLARLGSGGDAGYVWWEVDGLPVAVAGHAAPVPTPAGAVGRVGPVYTPPEHRRHGYGAAATAAVVELLLPRCATVMLLADETNPTSNGVYERLGFRPVAHVLDLDLERARGV
jgi:predicted GNAT family acetyltransferase